MKNQVIDTYLDENLSNFEGDMEIYTGEGDDFLNFAGGRNFAQELEASRVFVVNISGNTLNADAKIKIFNGYTDGDTSIASLKDGRNIIGDKEFTASGNPDKIKALQEFIQSVPSNLVGLRIQSDKPAQLQKVLRFVEKSPFHTNESKELFLGTYVSENTYKDTIVTVPTPGIILGPETQMIFELVAEANVSITFFFGTVLSTSSALKKKRARAISHIKAVGLPAVRRNNALKNKKNLRGLPGFLR